MRLGTQSTLLPVSPFFFSQHTPMKFLFPVFTIVMDNKLINSLCPVGLRLERAPGIHHSSFPLPRRPIGSAQESILLH